MSVERKSYKPLIVKFVHNTQYEEAVGYPVPLVGEYYKVDSINRGTRYFGVNIHDGYFYALKMENCQIQFDSREII